MDKSQHEEECSEVQAAIYRVALSLDSFLLNGIPYGVIHGAVFGGFLQKTAGTLLDELTTLEGQALRAPDASRPRIQEVLASLKAKCQQLIDTVTALGSFRALSLEQVRSAVAEVVRIRTECVDLIQELEACFQTSKPFYQSRPGDLTARMNEFLFNLERVCAEEWAASSTEEGGKLVHR